MKSRIITLPKTIAAYSLPKDKLGVLSEICKKENILLNTVLPENANGQIGFLCGFKGFDPPLSKCENPPEKECLIFAGFERKALQETLDLLKSGGVSVMLKAICTPSNQSWTLSDLLKELEREHAALNGGGQK